MRVDAFMGTLLFKSPKPLRAVSAIVPETIQAPLSIHPQWEVPRKTDAP